MLVNDFVAQLSGCSVLMKYSREGAVIHEVVFPPTVRPWDELDPKYASYVVSRVSATGGERDPETISGTDLDYLTAPNVFGWGGGPRGTHPVHLSMSCRRQWRKALTPRRVAVKFLPYPGAAQHARNGSARLALALSGWDALKRKHRRDPVEVARSHSRVRRVIPVDTELALYRMWENRTLLLYHTDVVGVLDGDTARVPEQCKDFVEFLEEYPLEVKVTTMEEVLE